MTTFVSGSLLQVFKSQGDEVAQASAHTTVSVREPHLRVELSATILCFGYLQESVTSCVLIGKALKKGMTENFLLEHEWVRKACADVPVASNLCQACTGFFLKVITLHHTQR